jgi:hypothetical protein
MEEYWSYVYRDANAAFANLWCRHIDIVQLPGHLCKVHRFSGIAPEQLSKGFKDAANVPIPVWHRIEPKIRKAQVLVINVFRQSLHTPLHIHMR